MSIASIAVVVVLFALVGFAIWRNFRKGAPCSCGGSHKDCDCGCCCCGDNEKNSTSTNCKTKGNENA